MEPQQDTPQAQASGPQLPDDFHKRIATKIVVTAERERDTEVALQNIASLVIRNLRQEGPCFGMVSHGGCPSTMACPCRLQLQRRYIPD